MMLLNILAATFCLFLIGMALYGVYQLIIPFLMKTYNITKKEAKQALKEMIHDWIISAKKFYLHNSEFAIALYNDLKCGTYDKDEFDNWSKRFGMISKGMEAWGWEFILPYYKVTFLIEDDTYKKEIEDIIRRLAYETYKKRHLIMLSPTHVVDINWEDKNTSDRYVECKMLYARTWRERRELKKIFVRKECEKTFVEDVVVLDNELEAELGNFDAK